MGARLRIASITLVVYVSILGWGAHGQSVDPELKGRVAGLLSSVTDLEQELDSLEKRKDQLTLEKMQKEIYIKDQARSIEKEKMDLTAEGSQLEAEKAKIDAFDKEIAEINASKDGLEKEFKKLESQKEKLLKDETLLREQLKTMGVDHYVEAQVQGMPPIMQKFIVKSTDAFSPVVDYVSNAVDTNNRLVDHVSTELDRFLHVNVQKSPFMSGLLFYFVILVPVLTATVLLIRLFKSTVKFTVSHFVLVVSIYFFLTCIGSYLGSIFQKSDMNVYLMFHHKRFYYAVLLIIALVYLWHICLIGLQALVKSDAQEISQLVASLSIALHYFFFVWRPAFLDRKPKMFTAYYLIYATIFGFLAYDRAYRLRLKRFISNPLTRWLESLGTIELRFFAPGLMVTSLLENLALKWKTLQKELKRRKSSSKYGRRSSRGSYSKKRSSGPFGLLTPNDPDDSGSDEEDSPAAKKRYRKRQTSFFSSSIDSASDDEIDDANGWAASTSHRRHDRSKSTRSRNGWRT